LSILANEVFAEAAGRSIARPLLSSADAPQIVESTIGREWHKALATIAGLSIKAFHRKQRI